MTDLTEMWAELEKYQPYAEKHGFGRVWKRMCVERTSKAAWSAWTSTEFRNRQKLLSEAAKAAWSAAAAASAAEDAEAIAEWRRARNWFTKLLPPYPWMMKLSAVELSNRTINRIQFAIKEEENHGS